MSLLLRLTSLFDEQIRDTKSNINEISSDVFSPSKLVSFRWEFAKIVKGIRLLKVFAYVAVLKPLP